MLAIAGKELLHIVRDPRTLLAVLALPLFELFLFAYALSFDVKHIPTAVVDLDRTPESRRFVDTFVQSGYFDVVQRFDAPKAVDAAFDSGSIRVAVIVGRGFGREQASSGSPAASVLIDGSEPNSAQLAQAYATGLTAAFGGGVDAEALARQGVQRRDLGGIVPAVRVWYNPDARSAIYLIPGLVVVLIMVVTVQQTANTLVREKEAGTVEQLTASPLRAWELMIGKLAPWAGLAALDVAAITLVGLTLFGVPFRGSVGLYILASALFVAGCLGFGLIISARAPSTEVANTLATLLSILPGFLLSGFVFPIRNMPVVLRFVTYLFPGRYFMLVNRTLFLKGTEMSVLVPQIASLAAYAAVTLVIASLLYRRRLA
jgi:ABC-2 type transport system permease protein